MIEYSLLEEKEDDNMLGMKKIRIGDVLIEKGLITQEQLESALAEQKNKGTKLGETLVDMGLVSEDNLIDVLCDKLGIEYVDLRRIKIDETVIKLIKEEYMKKNCLIPIGYDPLAPNILRVAMADPMDIMAVDDIAIITNLQVEPVLSTKTQINAQLDKFFGAKTAMAAAEQYKKEREKDKIAINSVDEEAAKGHEEIENSPIVQLVNTILDQAVRRRASDIHIEALEFEVRVRYRIDGSLVQVMNYDIELLSAIVARIKIIGGMDISEKRKPQDGRIAITVDRKDYDVRVSILPTVHGEKVVMRMTSKEGLTKDKKNLGFSDEEMVKFERILKNPHGIILVTGPTGSGKSTTLYTALSELNTEDVNIITVEDPVEADLDGINQVHVNAKAGLTFASALRSILRQDPDIIMIGEIRDGETADIAVKAAITGHLVVSTLHTNGTASTVTRLIDMGIEDYLIGDSLVGVIAQRLVRRLCTECKKAKFAEAEEKRLLGVNETEDLLIYEPCGCDSCNGTGYMGRIGVYEIMQVTPGLRVRISSGANANQIKEQAVSEGMLTLKDGAIRLCLDGITSFKEALKIAYEAE